MHAGLSGRCAVAALGAAVSWFMASGCGSNPDSAPPNQRGAGSTSAAVAADGNKRTPEPAPSAAGPKDAGALFKDAVLFEPPEGEQRPPDKTFAGKNVGALFEEIAGQDGAPGLWDKIVLTAGAGKRLRYTAQLKTDLGTIEIELFAASAPNHVRNFIALAQAGYYNGLPFHRSFNREVDGQTLAYLEGGCPLGTGEVGLGGIGYWLKPEIAATLTHEEGTIGAVRGATMDSAACKFYISLTRAPGLDGGYTIFGKIIKGLDIAHTINKRPNVEDGDMSDRPREPVILREVTIQAAVQDAAIVARTP